MMVFQILEFIHVNLSKISHVVEKMLLKGLCVTNWLENLMLFRLLILVI